MLFGLGHVGRQMIRARVGATTPAIDFSLLGPTLDPSITFTRVGTGATYFDSTGTLQYPAANVPRFDYDPAALTPSGLLVEEVRTNGIRNPRAEGAVVGVPGTLPTNWTVIQGTGLAWSVVGFGSESGMPYIDLRLSGTLTTQSPAFIQFETSTGVAAATGQTWTESFYLRLVAGSLANFSAASGITSVIIEQPGGTQRAAAGTITPTGASLASQRTQWTFTLATAGTANVNATIKMNFNTVPVAVDATFRVGMPQLELGQMATSGILPPVGTPAAQARAADSVIILSAPFITPLASTMVGEFMVPIASTSAAGTAYPIMELDDSTFNNIIELRNVNPGNVSSILFVANANVGTNTLGALTANAVMKAGLAVNGTTFACTTSLNGAAVATYSATNSPPILNRIDIGCGRGSQVNGWMRRVRYWPRVLSDAELQAVTAPDLSPSLVLDFMTPGSLDPRINFTRASTGTYFDSSGVMRTAPMNLLLWSTNFNNAAWGLFNGATKGAAVVGPDGNATGMTVNFAAQPTSQLYQTIAFAGGTTFSVYARANTSNSFTIRFSSGEISPTLNLTASWQQFSLTSVAAQSNLAIQNIASAAGSIDIAMPQLEVGSVATNYIPTTTAANGAPRWDYDPVTHALRGLLIEEQRINSIRNSTMVGAAAGTPGTQPTNWNINPGPSGLSSQVVGTGLESGITYIDIRIFGTAAAGANYSIFMDTTTGIAGLTAQAWNVSAYLRLVAGTMNGIPTQVIDVRENTSGGAFIRDNNTTIAAPTNAALVSQLCTSAITTSGGGTTAALQPALIFNITNAAAIDATFRIGAPQLEAGAFPTSYIPTTAAAVTRSADFCTIASANMGFFVAPGGSWSAEVIPVAPTVTGSARIIGRSATTGGQSPIYRQSALVLGQFDGASLLTANTMAGGVVAKCATTWTSGAATNCLNGGTIVSSAALTTGYAPLAAAGVFLLQNTLSTAESMTGWLRSVRYWPRVLSNAELQAATT